MDVDSNDPLHRIRPLLNVFKKTCGKYVDAGRDVSLDESSIAARSKFGANLIFFNPTKPGGKYHFRFIEDGQIILIS